MNEIQKEQLGISEKWKRFQLYSVQIACGSLSAYLVLSLEAVERIFARLGAAGVTFHVLFLVFWIVIGVLAIFCSGGIGLIRLINAKRVLQMIEKESKDE